MFTRQSVGTYNDGNNSIVIANTERGISINFVLLTVLPFLSFFNGHRNMIRHLQAFDIFVAILRDHKILAMHIRVIRINVLKEPCFFFIEQFIY